MSLVGPVGCETDVQLLTGSRLCRQLALHRIIQNVKRSVPGPIKFHTLPMMMTRMMTMTMMTMTMITTMKMEDDDADDDTDGGDNDDDEEVEYDGEPNGIVLVCAASQRLMRRPL